MTAFRRFGRFAIPFRLPLLFSPRMARVTAAETSSREGKRCPRIGSFNLWTSRSPVDSCLDCMARKVTIPTHIYLVNRSQPSPSAGVHFVQNERSILEQVRSVFCEFFCAIFASSHHNTLLSHLFHMELCLSWWFLGDHKQRSSFAWPLITFVEIFGSRGGWTYTLVWLRFELWFKVSDPRFVNSDSSIQECLTFDVKSLFQ